MQGRVLEVRVGLGDRVGIGEVVCVLEAMKMENEIVAELEGTVVEVAISTGDGVGPHDLLMRVEGSDGAKGQSEEPRDG